MKQLPIVLGLLFLTIAYVFVSGTGSFAGIPVLLWATAVIICAWSWGLLGRSE